VDVPWVQVEGRVTLGGEGVEGRIFFGGVHGEISIQAKTDDHGDYQATLPAQEDWSVDFVARRPRIFHRLARVDFDRSAGTARFDVELPDTLLEGHVVTRSGEPVDGANVLIVSFPATARPAYTKTDEEGTFAFHGHAYGVYWLEARFSSPEGVFQSETIEVKISKQAPSVSTRLVVSRMKELRGTVLSPVGGVPGASVEADCPPNEGPSPLMVPQTQTGSDGRFSLSLPVEVEEVDLLVMAPGFVLKRMRVATPGDTDVDVFLEQGGATLAMELGKPLAEYKFGESKPYVIQDGEFKLDVTLLNFWALTNGEPQEPGYLRIPGLPAGNYTVCWPAGPDREASCESGFLSIRGELIMTHSDRQETDRTKEETQ